MEIKRAVPKGIMNQSCVVQQSTALHDLMPTPTRPLSHVSLTLISFVRSAKDDDATSRVIMINGSFMAANALIVFKK